LTFKHDLSSIKRNQHAEYNDNVSFIKHNAIYSSNIRHVGRH